MFHFLQGLRCISRLHEMLYPKRIHRKSALNMRLKYIKYKKCDVCSHTLVFEEDSTCVLLKATELYGIERADP